MASPSQKPTRRPHAKTRTGCRVCKSRKVKCDETRPSCRNCLRRGIECDFAASAGVDPGNGVKGSSSGHTPNVNQIPSPAATSVNHSPPVDWFSVLDLELLHHYTTSTCFTFSTEPMVRNFWRVNVPRMGFSYQYVLKGVLSLSALHLARFKPQRKDMLIERAMIHQNASSSLALPVLDDLHGDNSVPILFFSMLTTFIAFASPKESSDLLVTSNGAMPQWLHLFRGMRSVVEFNGEAMTSFLSLGFIFDSGRQMNQIWRSMVPPEHEGLKELEASIRFYVKDAQKLEDLTHAIDELKRAFAFCNSANIMDEQRVRGVFMWLFGIRDGFTQLTKEHDNEALSVLAFFCVLLKRLDYIWWIEGWGVHLVRRIYNVLDEGYQLWIQWPIEEIGWVP
ncbi:uncharacterized protein GGS22DRAFT_198814 [Annulohypoxylon maeteangense]|uniref:uncharacterized protein n=1 Tax=Annulohypoxylon maeteangense TaxID=1927788 RepID=UPI002008BC69|nr:uncharacterized protein GGS22DRAFT_198814 [Annulohypoxylon maeteangense]KAI0887615.1 hypothetical protein GGS22DRAFT_198814 [Annulohypoxylon maeteangense]